MMRLAQMTADAIGLMFKAFAVFILLSAGPLGWIILYQASRRAPAPEPKPEPSQGPADWNMTHNDRKGIDK